MNPLMYFAFLGCLAFVAAEPQFGYRFAPGYYFRAGGFPSPSIDDVSADKMEGRFFQTVTLTLSTVTTTSTSLTTITCTSTAAGLAACSPAGRKRRSRREPLYNEAEYEESFLIPLELKSDKEAEKSVEVVEENRPVRQLPLVPFLIEPGFRSSAKLPAGRMLLAFATSTITATTISTSTSTLVAICASASSFPLCASG